MDYPVVFREVFRTRYGKVDELVALMKKSESIMATLLPDSQGLNAQWRFLVDHGGEMFHVIAETLTTFEAFARWSQALDGFYQQIEFKVWFNQMITCTEAGWRELYRVHMPPRDFTQAQGKVCVRNVFQARYGKADALVEHLGKESALAQKYGIPPLAIYTDLTGPMFTVVGVRDYASLAEWEQTLKQMDTLPAFGEWRRQLLATVEVGRREFYRIV